MPTTTTTAPTHTPRPETLVAVDWSNEGLDIAPVLAFVGDALISHESGEQTHWKTGAVQPFHRVTFDSRAIRNTEVHGRGYGCGFLVNIGY